VVIAGGAARNYPMCFRAEPVTRPCRRKIEMCFRAEPVTRPCRRKIDGVTGRQPTWILRNALHRVATDPRYAAARGGLMISGVEDVPNEAYRGLLDYEKQAAALGYPQLL
jgi:hypothetical protein